ARGCARRPERAALHGRQAGAQVRVRAGQARQRGGVTRMTRRFTVTLALAAALLLAGCGFRLQGASALPEGLDRVHVATRDELSAFAVELFRGLERAGAQRAASPGEADAVVRITADKTGRRVLSVSARNTPQEFEIFYQV